MHGNQSQYTDNNQIDRHNIIQQPGNGQNQNPGDNRDNWTYVSLMIRNHRLPPTLEISFNAANIRTPGESVNLAEILALNQ
jgi:hypothetical protein